MNTRRCDMKAKMARFRKDRSSIRKDCVKMLNATRNGCARIVKRVRGDIFLTASLARKAACSVDFRLIDNE